MTKALAISIERVLYNRMKLDNFCPKRSSVDRALLLYVTDRDGNARESPIEGRSGRGSLHTGKRVEGRDVAALGGGRIVEGALHKRQ